MDYEKFIRDRITELRIQAGLSEYRLSSELGRSHGYINSITRGKIKPSMSEFLSICECLEVTPFSFFDASKQMPALIQNITDNLNGLSDTDLQLVSCFINRLKDKSSDGR